MYLDDVPVSFYVSFYNYWVFEITLFIPSYYKFKKNFEI